MKYCPFCGAQIKDIGKFCTKCGKKLAASENKSLPMSREALELFRKGANLQAAGKPEEAIEYYDAALKINPNVKEILFSKQTALQLLERDDRYLRNKISKEKPQSQQKLLNIFYEVEEIIKSSFKDIPLFKKDINIAQEDTD